MWSFRQFLNSSISQITSTWRDQLHQTWACCSSLRRWEAPSALLLLLCCWSFWFICSQLSLWALKPIIIIMMMLLRLFTRRDSHSVRVFKHSHAILQINALLPPSRHPRETLRVHFSSVSWSWLPSSPHPYRSGVKGHRVKFWFLKSTEAEKNKIVFAVKHENRNEQKKLVWFLINIQTIPDSPLISQLIHKSHKNPQARWPTQEILKTLQGSWNPQESL